MQTVFVIMSILGDGYFLLRARRFDFFSVAYFSAQVYFLPGYVGYAMHPWYGDQSIAVPLVEEVYLVFLLVLMAIWAGAVCMDAVCREGEETGPVEIIPGGRRSCDIALLLSILGLIATFTAAGSLLFSPDKSVVLGAIGRWYVLWVMGGAVAAVIAYQRRNIWALGLALGLVLLDFFLGFRATTAITIGTIITLLLYKQGISRLIRRWRWGFLGAAVLCVLFFYKPLFPQVKTGDIQAIVSRTQDLDFYRNAILYSEPFTTQAILNEIMINRFRVDPGHFANVLLQFSLFSVDLGYRTPSFNDLFQPVLFPAYDWGLANNIWAEMWASGGWELLVLFVLVYVLVLAAGSFLLRFRNPELRALIGLGMMYWAAFIHRNDLSFQLNLEKQVMIAWLLTIGMTFAIAELARIVKVSKRGMDNQTDGKA